MKTSIELSLRTREVYQLFERKINGDILFLDAILHKFNKVINIFHKDESKGTNLIGQMEHRLLEGIRNFTDDINKYEQLLLKKKEFNQKRIDFVIQFHPSIIVTNSLGLLLIKFIDNYDQLIAIIKLLHLAGCFSEDKDYYFHIKTNQKVANKLLSSILLTSLK